jgi:hypothetical protein
MYCGGGHLRFPIGIKHRNLVKDIPMIIQLQFGFSQFISFREEDLWNFSQSEHIIGPGSHVEYPTGMKNSNFVEDHPRNIWFKLAQWFRRRSLKCEKFTDDGRQVMAIVHLDLWSRWTKKGCTRLAAASDKAYQLLAHGRWFSPSTPASSTTKTGCHDIAEILLKVS